MTKKVTQHNYLTIDLETSIENRGDRAVGKFQATPFFKGNQIVAYGWKARDDPKVSTTYLSDPKWDLSKIDLLVAHNAQFEMAWLLTKHKEEFTEWLKAGGKIWDTMTVEYLLTNLLHKFPSLDDTCIKYGGKLKNDVIKEYWKAGIRTEDIPKLELIPYLELDVLNTEKVFKGQYKKAVEKGMLNLIDCHMEAMLALITMNLNGLKFDVKFARTESYRLTNELLKLRESATSFMKKYFVPEFEINPGSDRQLSSLLFGGPYKYRKRGAILNVDGTLACKKERRQVFKVDEDNQKTYYKSGKRKGEAILRWETFDGEPKTKWYEYIGLCKGLGFTPHKNWTLKDKRYFSVGEDNLKVLIKQAKTKEMSSFLSTIIKINTVNKDLSTYFIGYSNLVFPDSGLIHPNFNTCFTSTGRLSSSRPIKLGFNIVICYRKLPKRGTPSCKH